MKRFLRDVLVGFLASFLAACSSLHFRISSLLFFGPRLCPFLSPAGMHLITSITIPILYSICLYLMAVISSPKSSPFIKSKSGCFSAYFLTFSGHSVIIKMYTF